ncbi:hypothetical protein L210DRAFT_268146 [Boletus edulis BED1]|uniref:Uncharacterized protein n=1 Tax=Boletus edulis BED1 TaxID=1328754 RepID=A0AAD4C892_BOLED|nr:hypothetical protein L210DRAFT_268146 [Boletus edulis BED1]
MPVPVPPVPTAHPVHKRNKSGDSTNLQSSAFHLLKHTLPSSPTGPPPSFGSREQWISSLPSWRRTKARYVWESGSRPAVLGGVHQGFSRGLAGAVDAPAIKGAHVQTCIPPLKTLSTCSSEMPPRNAPPYDQPIGPTSSSDLGTYPSPPPELIGGDVPSVRASPHAPDLYFEDDGGLFAPILEDDSPDMMSGDMGSSPIEPVTPFGDYVDRAVAASDATVLHDFRLQELHLPISVNCDTQFCHLYPCPHVEAKEESVAVVNEHPPTANLLHKQLAEPMAEWLVTYVWKVCTNALVLPQTIAPYALPNAPQLRQPMPLYLTARVHSLLMSTLLQPSAMLLALWYIVRLPVYLGASGLGPEHVKERRFRVELLSDTRDALEGESLEGTATFRLIVLGCMLANKWLDDHTFSNKTWHTISNVSVQLLNKLEYFALDILSHDLSISPSVWSQWLSHLLSYHHSLTMTTYPQPIARPVANSDGIIRKTIQEIMEAPLGRFMNEPVFLGVEQRLKDKFGLSTLPHEPETFDIDLDEDGPLREEYLPKRRVSNGGSSGGHGLELRNHSQNRASVHHHRTLPLQGSVSLPPPAKWSPAGDEPICRPSGRTAPMYLPVQPTLAPHYVGTVPTVYHPWPTTGLPYAPFGHHSEGDHAVNTLPIPRYAYWAPMSCPSAVQHPYPVCDSDYYTGPDHVRGYSLGGFDYVCSDIRLSSGGIAHPAASCTPLHQHGYLTSRQSLAPHPPSLNYRSTWIRA